MIDVGQGDSTLFYIDKKIVLIDTGGVVMYNDSKYKYNIAKNILLYLKSKGIRKVDHLILTHGDADHMMESTYIINNFKVGNIYLNSNKLNYLETEVYNLAVKKNINIKFLEENDYINIGKYKINSLNKNRKDENDSSIVLYTNINNNKVLITGDISKNIELDIINKYNLENLNIIKLAHHGSNTSNDYEFLKKTNPNLAIISASLNNKYNHPSKETIDNLKKLNIKYLETSKVGSIKINLDDGTKILYEP